LVVAAALIIPATTLAARKKTAPLEEQIAGLHMSLDPWDKDLGSGALDQPEKPAGQILRVLNDTQRFPTEVLVGPKSRHPLHRLCDKSPQLCQCGVGIRPPKKSCKSYEKTRKLCWSNTARHVRKWRMSKKEKNRRIAEHCAEQMESFQCEPVCVRWRGLLPYGPGLAKASKMKGLAQYSDLQIDWGIRYEPNSESPRACQIGRVKKRGKHLSSSDQLLCLGRQQCVTSNQKPTCVHGTPSKSTRRSELFRLANKIAFRKGFGPIKRGEQRFRVQSTFPAGYLGFTKQVRTEGYIKLQQLKPMGKQKVLYPSGVQSTFNYLGMRAGSSTLQSLGKDRVLITHGPSYFVQRPDVKDSHKKGIYDTKVDPKPSRLCVWRLNGSLKRRSRNEDEKKRPTNWVTCAWTSSRRRNATNLTTKFKHTGLRILKLGAVKGTMSLMLPQLQDTAFW
jgi:hypothetical protein